MTTVQRNFQGRNDGETLNSVSFDHDLDSGWTQLSGEVLRLRFEIEETAGTSTPLSGTLEASYRGGSYFPVTASNGTVAAAASVKFDDLDPTTDVLSGSTKAFVAGVGSETGTFGTITLDDSHTELEFAVRIPSGRSGTVAFRVGGLDSYVQTPRLLVSDFDARSLVRLKIGDTDATTMKLSDTEIDQLVAQWPENPDLAAANAAEAIAASLADNFDFTTDGQTFNRSQQVDHYKALADALRERGGVIESS